MTVPDWLAGRLADTPPLLRRRLEAVLAELEPGADLAAALLGAACEILERIRDRLAARETAFDLLVADGLLTFACEAAALEDPESLVDGCRLMGPGGELGRLAERWAGRR